MNRSLTRAGFVAGASALTLTASAFASSVEDQAQRIAELEAKVAQLSGDNWLTDQRADEIRNIVQDVLADADTRASLLQSGMTAGYDNGAVLGSADGNFLLRTNILMQQRFIWNNQDDDAAVDNDRWGFENTRTKFILSGHVVNPSWFYHIDINVGSPDSDYSSGRGGVGNAYLGYSYENGGKIIIGSMKAPLLREELVNAEHQLLVERSNANYIFTGGYVDGIAYHWAGDQFRFTAAFTDGASTGQTVWSTADTEISLTGRVEALLNGNWDQFKDFTSPQGSEMGFMLGGAFHYQKEEATGSGVPADLELWIATVDASVEGDGWNAFLAFIYADVDPGGGGSTNPWSIVAQGGFYLDPEWELFARYEFGDFDNSAEDLNAITVGVNKYFAGHNAKWTTDIGFGVDAYNGGANGVNGIGSTGITGWRSDIGDNDGQIVVRTQFQILY